MSYVVSLKNIFDSFEEYCAQAQVINFKHIYLDSNDYDSFCIEEKIKILSKYNSLFTIYNPLLKPIDLHNAEERSSELENIKNHLEKFKGCYPEFFMYELPNFSNVVQDYDLIAEHLKNILLLFKSTKIVVLIKPSKYLANTYTYILKKLNNKQLKLFFDPIYFQKKESLSTVYRQLYEYIGVLYVVDEVKKHKNSLIGKGNTKIVELLKKISQDRLNIKYLNNLTYNEVFKIDEKKNFLQKIFEFKYLERKNKQKFYANQLFNNKKENITIGDVFNYERDFLISLKLF